MSQKWVQWENGIQRYYSHVATVKVPKDRKQCLMPVITKRNPASMFTNNDNNLRLTHKFTWWVMESRTTVDLWLPSVLAHFV